MEQCFAVYLHVIRVIHGKQLLRSADVSVCLPVFLHLRNELLHIGGGAATLAVRRLVVPDFAESSGRSRKPKTQTKRKFAVFHKCVQQLLLQVLGRISSRIKCDTRSVALNEFVRELFGVGQSC